MAVAAAEALHETSERSEAFSARDYDREAQAIQAAAELIRSIGSIPVREAFKEDVSQDRARNLKEAIYQAPNNPEARAQVEANVRKDLGERAFKVAHVSTSKQQIDADGRISQHGQYSDETHLNAIKYASDNPLIFPYTIAQIRNSKRIHLAAQDGTLDTHWMVVFSRCAVASDKKLKEAGFFELTKSASIQATTVIDGEVVTQSAFVAGVRHPNAKRHDDRAVEAIGEDFDVDYSGMTTAEIADTPIFIPKDMVPDEKAAIMFAKLFDEKVGGTWCGQDNGGVIKSWEEYEKLIEVSQEREANFEPLVQKITDQLIAERHQFESPTDATERLDKLSAYELIDKSLLDDSIDPLVFGYDSAHHVRAAREHVLRSEYEQAISSVQVAKSVEQSTSCPSGGKNKKEKMPGELESEEESTEEFSWHGGKISVGKCVNCEEEPKQVGVKSWCEDCIRDHCGKK
jgi:hypothetical protein